MVQPKKRRAKSFLSFVTLSRCIGHVIISCRGRPQLGDMWAARRRGNRRSNPSRGAGGAGEPCKSLSFYMTAHVLYCTARLAQLQKRRATTKQRMDFCSQAQAGLSRLLYNPARQARLWQSCLDQRTDTHLNQLTPALFSWKGGPRPHFARGGV